ncbi:short-chain dehydrogenase [Apiospora kogelbergensis]|uniref:Short-chain dehydrogenase n=1 Tax=Apiospora kogelbergensis TaxID=1337665 RepID=A0AAW0QRF4_9PEZI
MAAGTIILTGANGSLALHAADYLLKSYPDYHAVFAVRDAADADPNTQRLRDIMALYPESQCSIHQVDHAELSTVHEFAGSLAASVASGELPPLKAIICNASYWNLVSDPELTVDGYEKAIQVSHIAHVALIMRLTGSFSDDGGRIVLFSSISHYRRPNFMTHLLPVVPDGTDDIVHPAPGDQKQAYGMQRYATGKFLITTWMYALNRHLQENPKSKNITVVAVNPGDLGDSRAFFTNTPYYIQLMFSSIVRQFLPVFTYLVGANYRSSSTAGVDVVELAVNKAHPNEHGYFTMLEKDISDPITMDRESWRMFKG